MLEVNVNFQRLYEQKVAILKKYLKHVKADTSELLASIVPLLNDKLFQNIDLLVKKIKTFENIFSKEDLKEIISSVKNYINSRDFEVPGRFVTTSYLFGGFQWKSESDELQLLNKKLDELSAQADLKINEEQSAEDSASTSWSESFSYILNKAAYVLGTVASYAYQNPVKVTTGFLYTQAVIAQATQSPVFVNNKITIDYDSQVATLAPYMIRARDLDTADSNLMFNVSSTYGRFVRFPDNQTIFGFNQEEINNRTIGFLSSVKDILPSYQISVSDGINFVGPVNGTARYYVKTVFPAEVELSDLGQGDVVRINGEVSGDKSGYSVSSAGDFNGDKIDDIIISSPYSSSLPKSHVVFLRNSILLRELNLTNINGENGITIKSKLFFDFSGISGSSLSYADINRDGISDVMVCSPGFSTFDMNGRADIVYGGTNLPSEINVSNLNGTNGLSIYGVNPGDHACTSISGGDFNKDGIVDLAIGSKDIFNKAGVVDLFLGREEGFPARLYLNESDIRIVGAFPGDSIGTSISLGDFNDDGYDDLFVGSPNSPTLDVLKNGVVYGIHGFNSSLQVIINATNINVIDGFKMIGYHTSGYKVVMLGDVNGDGIFDAAVIASQANVVFYGKAIGNAGIISIVFGSKNNLASEFNFADLNGKNGFNAYIMNQNSNLVISFNDAGDFNGDGSNDLIACAPTMGFDLRGNCYIILGHYGSWPSVIDLSKLDGVIGFKINGENPNDHLGMSVSSAGDINADGFSDILIGAPMASPYGKTNAGITYLVFGGMAPYLINNNLVISNDQTRVYLTTSNLYAKLDSGIEELVNFIIYDLQNGRLYLDGVLTNRFSLLDIKNNRVWIELEPGMAPSYTVATQKGNMGMSAKHNQATITYTYPDYQMTLQKNELTIQEEGSVILSSDNLSAVAIGLDLNKIVFIPVKVRNCRFELITQQGESISQFSQYQLSTHQVRLVATGGVEYPSYEILLNDGSVTRGSPVAASIQFNRIQHEPVFVNNWLTIGCNQTVTLNPIMLKVTDLDTPDTQIIFTVVSVQHGLFTYGNTVVTQFTQNDINLGKIQFTHDGSSYEPSCDFKVIYGLFNITSATSVKFTSEINGAPVFSINPIPVIRSTPTILNAQMISSPFNQTIFKVEEVSGGMFTPTNAGSLVPVTSFTQAEVNKGEVQFVPDSAVGRAPTISLSVSNQYLQTPVIKAQTPYTNDGHDIEITQNILDLMQGDRKLILPNFLSAMYNGQPIDGLTFVISNVTNGRFEYNSSPGNPITSFQQGHIAFGGVYFVHDGSEIAPRCKVFAINNGYATQPAATSVTFTKVVSINPTSAPIAEDDILTQEIINKLIIGAVSGGVGLFFLIMQIVLKYYSKKYLNEAGECKDETDVRAELRKKFIKPIVNKLYSKVTLTGCMGYADEDVMREYFVSAERVVVEFGKLMRDSGLPIDFIKMDPENQIRLECLIVEGIIKKLMPEACCCVGGFRFFRSFCKADISPKEIEGVAVEIAEYVKSKWIGDQQVQTTRQSSVSVAMSDMRLEMAKMREEMESCKKASAAVATVEAIEVVEEDKSEEPTVLVRIPASQLNQLSSPRHGGHVVAASMSLQQKPAGIEQHKRNVSVPAELKQDHQGLAVSAAVKALSQRKQAPALPPKPAAPAKPAVSNAMI